MNESSAADLLSPVSDDVRPSKSSSVSANISSAKDLSSSWLFTNPAKVEGGPGSETISTNCLASSIKFANSSFASWYETFSLSQSSFACKTVEARSID